MKMLLVKTANSVFAAGALIAGLYWYARLSGSANPMYFFDMAMFGLTIIALLTAVGLLIAKLLGPVNINYAIFTAVFSLLHLVILGSMFTKGVSIVYFIVGGINLFVVVALGVLIFNDYLRKRNSIYRNGKITH